MVLKYAFSFVCFHSRSGTLVSGFKERKWHCHAGMEYWFSYLGQSDFSVSIGVKIFRCDNKPLHSWGCRNGCKKRVTANGWIAMLNSIIKSICVSANYTGTLKIAVSDNVSSFPAVIQYLFSLCWTWGKWQNYMLFNFLLNFSFALLWSLLLRACHSSKLMCPAFDGEEEFK